MLHTIAAWYFDWGWLVALILAVPIGRFIGRTEKWIRNLLIFTLIYFAIIGPLYFFK